MNMMNVIHAMITREEPREEEFDIEAPEYQQPIASDTLFDFIVNIPFALIDVIIHRM
jgi:hypothetical protein